MKEQLYKNVALSFIVINIWTLYSFFDYYNEFTHDKYGMSSLTLFFNFVGSAFVAICVGVLAIILRFTVFRTKRKALLKENFFYIFTGLFNLNLLVIWIISVVMGFLPPKTTAFFFMLGILVVSGFILFDVFTKEKIGKEKLGNI